ncbi:hypothetical protein IAT38_002298 [Cryptococcus sp. DSM 104549]
MRLSTALPLVLLPLSLAHAHGDLIRPAHHRKGLARGSPAANAAYRRAPGLLNDLTGKDDDASSSAAASSPTSSAAAASSAASSVGPSSAVSSTTKPAANDDTSTSAVQSALSTSAVQSSTTGASESGSAAVGASASATGSGVSASLPGASSVANGTDAASSTGQSSSEASSSAKSSDHSSVVQATVTSSEPPASVQYTTDAAGQTQLITVILTQSAAAAADSTATATTTAAPSNKGDGGISTAAIIGISVGVGAAILALILLALWRMKRRTGDEDEAIRWPELNRHGDSDAHHALPAHQTGKHGIETSELERTLSNSSSIIYSPSGGHHTSGAGGLGVPGAPVPMALNGSSFGAASSLEDDYSAMEKAYPPSPSAHHYPLDQPQPHDQMTQIPPHSPHPPSPHSHDDHDNYTSLPPPQLPLAHTADMGMGLGMGMGYGHGAQTDDEDEDPYAGVAVAMPQPVLHPGSGYAGHGGYQQAGSVSPGPETVGHQGRYRIE